jgi:hypothetical protein
MFVRNARLKSRKDIILAFLIRIVDMLPLAKRKIFSLTMVLMLTHKDKDILKPALATTRKAIMAEQKFKDQDELIDAVIFSDKLITIGGLTRQVYLYLIGNFYAPDTQAWIRKLVTL